MDSQLKKILLAGWVFILSGCTGPQYFEPLQAKDPANGVVYIFRPHADNPGRQPLSHSYPDILLDEHSIGVLELNTYLATELSAGAHHIRVTGLTQKARWDARDIEQDLNLAPGESKYLKLDVRFNISEMSLGQPGPKYTMFLTPVDAQDAIYEIRETDPAD